MVLDETSSGFQICFDPNCDLSLFVPLTETDIKKEPPLNLRHKVLERIRSYGLIIANLFMVS